MECIMDSLSIGGIDPFSEDTEVVILLREGDKECEINSGSLNLDLTDFEDVDIEDYEQVNDVLYERVHKVAETII